MKTLLERIFDQFDIEDERQKNMRFAWLNKKRKK